MAIGPIGGAGSSLPDSGAGAAARRVPPPRAQAQQSPAPQPLVVRDNGGLVPTYSEIRIGADDRVSVKVFDADTDELLIVYPPTELSKLADVLRQAAGS